jgi:hypothetical protein
VRAARCTTAVGQFGSFTVESVNRGTGRVDTDVGHLLVVTAIIPRGRSPHPAEHISTSAGTGAGLAG